MKLILTTSISILLSTALSADAINANNNGVFFDKDSGLQWQDDYSDNKGKIQYLDWDGANKYCKNLTLDGGKWRLPTLEELRVFVRHSKYEQLKEAKSKMNPSKVNNYWTSKEREENKDYAWRVSFLYHNVYYFKKSLATNVRCIRTKTKN